MPDVVYKRGLHTALGRGGGMVAYGVPSAACRARKLEVFREVRRTERVRVVRDRPLGMVNNIAGMGGGLAIVGLVL